MPIQANARVAQVVKLRARSLRRLLLDSLEPRQLLSNTPFSLSTGSLIQNWENASLITTANNWSGVSSIEGFSGVGLTSASNVDPQTLIAAEASPAQQVAANVTSNPGTYTTGGVSEMQLSAAIAGSGSNTVAFQGSATSPAPYLKFYLNSTGTQSVRIKYDLIDIDSGASTANQQVALQYRIGSSGSYTNVPAAYVQNASDFTSGATGKTTSIDVTLPTNANNVGLIEVRVMTSDASGSDQLIAVENINISATPIGPGQFSLEQSAVSIAEGGGSQSFVVHRTGGTSGAVSVAYSTLNGSAVAPGDYTATSGVLNFADSQDTASFSVPIIDDTDGEGNETFSVSLSAPTGGATLGSPSTTTVTIIDNEVPGTLGFDPASYSVAENGGAITLTVTRTVGNAGAVSVAWDTVNGSATSPSDFTGASGVLNFASGETSKTFSITIVDDIIIDPSEQFAVVLTNPTNGATLGAANTATVSITDNDVAGELAFDPANYSVAENGTSVTLNVVRTLGLAGAVSVAWATVNGSATSPGDFTGASGVLNFAAGETSKPIVIQIVDDNVAEAIEQFTVALSNVTGGATIGSANTATVVISDNDTPGPNGLVLNEISINPPGTNAPYQFVELRGTPNLALTNVYLIDIEGDSGQNPGKINGIIPITATLGSNGLLLIGSSAGFVPQAVGTAVMNSTFFDVGQPGFQQGSNSFALVYNEPTIGSFALNVGDDLDAANSGALTLPGSVFPLDIVGSLDGNTSDKAYGAVLGPIGTNAFPNAADALVRFFNNTAPSTAPAWFYGDLAGAANNSLTFTGNPALLSQNFPAGAVLTPGGVLTGVLSVVLDYSGTSQSILVTFTKDVSTTLDASDFELTNLTTGGTPVTLTLLSVSPDGTVARLGFSNTGGLLPTILVDGDYQLKVKAGSVGDANDLLPTDHNAPLFFKNGDFNRDRKTNFDDLLILAQHYGMQSGATFAIGDINYDGKVNFDDLLAFAQRYNTQLLQVPPPSTKATTAAKKRSGFSNSVIA